MSIECPYCIVLADDHAMFRQGVKSILSEKAEFQVVGEAADGLEVLNLLNLSKLTPHLVILDISMPHMSGIEATPRIKMTNPNTRVLILSMHRENEYIDRALAAGADGYLLKDDAPSELFRAIEKVRKGEFYISPLLPQGDRF